MVRRIVVKVGTTSLVLPGGIMRHEILNPLVSQIAQIREQGYQVLVVTSGATETGLGKEPRLADIEDRILRNQVAAFIGQATIARAWEEAFGRFGITAGQILRTHQDFRNGTATEFMERTLDLGFVPVINEDDTRSREEIEALEEKGDNDMLASCVALAVAAERVLLLTDVDGVFDKNPKLHANAQLVSLIARIDEQTWKFVEEVEAGRPTGLRSKLKAAAWLQARGIATHIANAAKWVIVPILEGKQIGTTIPSL